MEATKAQTPFPRERFGRAGRAGGAVCAGGGRADLDRAGAQHQPAVSRRADVLVPDLLGRTRAEAEADPTAAALAVTWRKCTTRLWRPGVCAGSNPPPGALSRKARR